MSPKAFSTLAVALAAGHVACVPPVDPVGKARPQTAGTGGQGRGELPPRPEKAWLAGVGTGPAQTARVCNRGARDRVRSALCGSSASSIHGLSDLYRALGFAEPASRYVASTTHSLGLSARIVSAANPRSFVFPPEKAPIPSEHLVATGFTRGEQFVELAALDSVTFEYNFYLLEFEQSCNATRCTPDDLLTAKVESGWTGFTLYGDVDLVDTPLDCLSCHLPFGAGTYKQLVMRQTAHPWLHWGDFRGVYENRVCVEHAVPEPGSFIPGEGLALMARLEGRDGRHAGVPVPELVDSASGERFSLFLTDAENTIRNSSRRTAYPYAQFDFDSSVALCERFRTGKSPSWEQARTDSLTRGLPVPYHSEDVMDPAKRAELSADRAGFFARHAAEDPFDVAMSLVGAEAATAVGFVPRPDATAEQMLREMCVRCHAETTDTRLKRAKFNAERIEPLLPEAAAIIRERIMLPRSSPELMPPLRAGELPPWAIARIDAFLREHCSVPGGCG